jgi:hypothetical protein
MATQPADELGQRLAGAFGERRTLRLTVIGQHDNAVRPRRPAAGPVDAADLAVEVAQDGEGVGALGTRVMGDLVVAEEVDVDRGAPFTHVVDDSLHGDVAADHRRERTEQGVRPVAFDAGLDVAAPLETGSASLPGDLADQRQQRAGGLLGS